MEQLSLCITTAELVLQSPGTTITEHACQHTEACVPWSPRSATREATTMRSPSTATREQPRLQQLEKRLHNSEDPAQPKIKKQSRVGFDLENLFHSGMNLPSGSNNAEF